MASPNNYPFLTSSSSNEDEPLERMYEEWRAAFEREQQMLSTPSPQAPSSSSRRRRTYIDRGREEGHNRLFKDYFDENSTYTEANFRRRFRMSKALFKHIVDRLSSGMVYFQQRCDATGRAGLSPLQKCTTALRCLAYGYAGDAVDEYVRIGASTVRECLVNFVEGVISFFGEEYLRRPTPDDLRRILKVGEFRGFPGMLESIDCMHWEWKNCPTAWHGQYTSGHQGHPTIILEAVASYDLWIWHAFFGTPGTCNDINVLDRSPVFDDVLQGRAPNVRYVVNGREYNMGYYLTDGIYPPWATFIQTVRLPQSDKHKLFAQRQEAARKDVERAFGVLQARFAIIRNPALSWNKHTIRKIIRACIILHNMIIEDSRDNNTNYHYNVSEFAEQAGENGSTVVSPTFSTDRPLDMSNYLTNRIRVRNSDIHHQLKSDLVEHIWRRFGMPNNRD